MFRIYHTSTRQINTSQASIFKRALPLKAVTRRVSLSRTRDDARRQISRWQSSCGGFRGVPCEPCPRTPRRPLLILCIGTAAAIGPYDKRAACCARIISRFVACVPCVRAACIRACVRARMRHGCRGVRRMRDLQLGPDHGGRRVVRSTEAWRVEPAMAVGGPERRREGHAMQNGSGELLIFCHCKLIYSMGPLLSPPVVHVSCALWGCDVPVFRAPFCPSTFAFSLLSLPSPETSRSLSLPRFVRALVAFDVVAWLQRAIGCTPAALRYAVPLLRLFSPAQRGISLFFHDHCRRKIFTCTSSPHDRASLLGEFGRLNQRRDVRSAMNKNSWSNNLSTYEEIRSALNKFHCMRKSMINHAINLLFCCLTEFSREMTIRQTCTRIRYIATISHERNIFSLYNCILNNESKLPKRWIRRRRRLYIYHDIAIPCCAHKHTERKKRARERSCSDLLIQLGCTSLAALNHHKMPSLHWWWSLDECIQSYQFLLFQHLLTFFC